MDRRLGVLLLIAGLAAAAYPTLAAPPGLPQTRAFTLAVTAFACDDVDDNVCLAYNGASPGPTLDVNLGDTLVITLVNHIAETLPAGAPTHLATAPVSWHVHGTALSSAVDGVMAHPGTQLVSSVAEPGGSFTYTVRAAYAGAWHYHDHVLGPDGSEGVARGLYGALVVRSGAALRPDVVIDLHALNDGLVASAASATDGPDAGSDVSFELVIVGLEDLIRTVDVLDPAGAIVATVTTGPGLSESVLVEGAQPGDVYRWRASGPMSPGHVRTGQVVVS